MAGLTMPDAELERRVVLSPPVTAEVDVVLSALEREATDLAAVRAYETGQYYASIHRVFESGPWRRIRAAGRAGVELLPIWLERGTGIYGPKGTVIRAKTKKGMIFPVKGQRASAGAPARFSGSGKGGAWVRTMSVKGRPASHVMRDAGRNVAERLGLRWVGSS